ncbi:hypothetical protein GCM10009827_046750 [Dactylosporangium maewongense]|uniref:Uncharacterized protein n=1 Tax=Dactylosporangium maewongense TaxID=634393 RepID=A0ABN2AT96_9ACTN
MTADPVARAVLRRLAELRPPDDPLHAFATTVLTGEATLRAAATHPAFTEALQATLEATLEAALHEAALHEAALHDDRHRTVAGRGEARG